MSTKAYHITHWDQLYETAETRKIRTLTYYAKPNKLVGEGIGYTLSQADGPHLLGMWALIECLASTAPQQDRGWLVRNGTPLDANRMSALTRIAAEHFVRALEFFSGQHVGWLELAEWPSKKPAKPDERDKAGTPPADSPGKKPDERDNRETAGPISPRGSTDKRGKTKDTEEREKNGGFATKEEARRAQQTQFAALQRQISELEAIPEEDRTEEHDQDLKKKRRVLNRLQKNQAAGNFAPVKEEDVE